jgi:hypothetical protein
MRNAMRNAIALRKLRNAMIAKMRSQNCDDRKNGKCDDRKNAKIALRFCDFRIFSLKNRKNAMIAMRKMRNAMIAFLRNAIHRISQNENTGLR